MKKHFTMVLFIIAFIFMGCTSRALQALDYSEEELRAIEERFITSFQNFEAMPYVIQRREWPTGRPEFDNEITYEGIRVEKADSLRFIYENIDKTEHAKSDRQYYYNGGTLYFEDRISGERQKSEVVLSELNFLNTLEPKLHTLSLLITSEYIVETKAYETARNRSQIVVEYTIDADKVNNSDAFKALHRDELFERIRLTIVFDIPAERALYLEGRFISENTSIRYGYIHQFDRPFNTVRPLFPTVSELEAFVTVSK